MPDASLAVTLTDNYSSKVKTMASTTTAFSKEMAELAEVLEVLEGKQDTYTKSIAEQKTQITLAKQALTEATKAHKENQTEASKTDLDKASLEYEELTAKLKLFQSESSNVRSEMTKLSKEADSLALGMTSSSSTSSFSSSVVTGIAASVAGSMVGDAVGTIAGSVATSGLGSSGGSIFSSMLSGLTTGAVMGSAVGTPGVGTAIGAAVGGTVGLVSGIASVESEKDSYFIDYYNGLYEEAVGIEEARLSAGSSIAASREQTAIAFNKLLGEEGGTAFLEEVKTMAKSTNYSYDEVTGYSKLLLNVYDTDRTMEVLQQLSDATAGLSLDDSDVSMFISGLSRMETTGKTTQEYLNYFSERGLDVYDALASYLEVDESLIADMVTASEISGHEGAEAILAYITERYGGLSEALMGTYTAMSDNMEDVMADIEEAYGIGYNDTRVLGLAAEQDAYEGSLGAAEEVLGGAIGQNAAFMENLGEQYTREARSAVLEGGETTLYDQETADTLATMHQDYAAALGSFQTDGNQEAALQMESLSIQASAMAQAAYESSAQYQLVHEVELDSIEATRELTAAFSGWTLAYEASQESSKGQVNSSKELAFGEGDWTANATVISPVATMETGEIPFGDWTATGAAGLAYGLDRVPYDGFPAILHEGERVKTASEARAEDRNSGGSVTITGNQFIVREEADIDKIVQALAERAWGAGVAGVF